jgi:hypothetical protein
VRIVVRGEADRDNPGVIARSIEAVAPPPADGTKGRP